MITAKDIINKNATIAGIVFTSLFASRKFFTSILVADILTTSRFVSLFGSKILIDRKNWYAILPLFYNFYKEKSKNWPEYEIAKAHLHAVIILII